MTKRTDPHRKGAIIPAEYTHVLSYNGPTTQEGRPVPSFGVNCELDRRVVDKDGKLIKNGEHDPDGRCCYIGLLHIAKVKFAKHGGNGQCTACGTHFVYGEVWQHIPTGEHINVGHICGQKYGLMVDRSAFELEAGRRRAAAAMQIQREQNKEEREAFLAEHPGLAEALETDHHIVQDIKANFAHFRSLSDKQIALVLKLANEVANPKPEEAHVPAPEGKQTFQGRVVAVKLQEGYYGDSLKATVKVDTPDGSWVAWGTAPKLLLDLACDHGGLRGCKVEITATLTRSDRDEHFAFMKRPRGKMLEFGAQEE